MNLLKREIAPITQLAWEEIDEAAREVIEAKLTSRKVLKVHGPYGFEKNSVDEGRLVKFDDNDSVMKASYKLRNLIEARVQFELPKWELDNIERGAKDIELAPLEEAVEKLCAFEDDFVYNGYEKAASEGMTNVAANKIELGTDANNILKAISDGMLMLEDAYCQKPYNLVVSNEIYNKLNVIEDGKHLLTLITTLIGGKILRSQSLEGGLLIPDRDEDLELTIGQDFSIGYQSENEDKVKLFVTESLAFRVLDKDKIVYFTS